MKNPNHKNPIIPRLGVCDPHIHIFQNKAYLYATHDVPGGTFQGSDWEIWSSPDLINWEKESSVRPDNTSMGPSHQCWAVDAGEKDGKYYLYVSNGQKETYVFTSDDPGKGFVDLLGHPVIPEGITKTFSYDPAIFADDDGQQYIVFGAPVWVNADSYYIAKLGEDMMSLAEAPRKIQLDDTADDKPTLHKHNGIYYLSWGSYYATSDNVYGPYTTRGNLNLSIDHTSVFQWNNQWFMAFTIEETVKYCRRATGIAYVHFRENGEMCSDSLIREYGVGQYDALWNNIEAEWYMAGENIRKKENSLGNFDVEMHEGSSLTFPHVRNIPENAWLMLVGVAEQDVDVEVYADGRLAGVLRKEKSILWAGEFTKYRGDLLKLDVPAGEHDIRLVTRGDLRLNFMRFLTE